MGDDFLGQYIRSGRSGSFKSWMRGLATKLRYLRTPHVLPRLFADCRYAAIYTITYKVLYTPPSYDTCAYEALRAVVTFTKTLRSRG